MTLADISGAFAVPLGTLSLAVSVGGYFLGRSKQKNAESAIAERAGADRERLNTLERWQQNASVDRSEFTDLKAEVAEVKADVQKTAEIVRNVELQMASIPAELKSIRDLMERDGRETRHDVSSMKMSIEKLTNLFLQQRTS